jgi:hypothetical protein
MELPAPIWVNAGISIPICQSGRLMGFVHQPAVQAWQNIDSFLNSGGSGGTLRRLVIQQDYSAWHAVFRARRYLAAASRFFDKSLKSRCDLPLTFHLPTEIQIPLGLVNE